jgi:ribosomal protein S15P/S13E
LILLKEDLNLGTALKGFAGCVLANGERTASSGFPNVLVIIVVFRSYDDAIADQVSRVETDTELTDHADVSTRLQSLHEVLGTGASDGTEIVHEVGLGHTDTGIDDCDGVVGLVGHDANVQALGVSSELGLVRQTFVANLVQRIRSVRDHFTKENLFVAVESVDNQTEQLIDFSLEGKGFNFASRSCGGSSVSIGHLSFFVLRV